ncbi:MULTISPECIES: DUF6050 family protein [unclassified Ruminococcus]|uniref:DUF6050 family protein n=1 Tax=unclassified Ruminococcus TaxID=2608920 RepID=UPI00319E22BB
MKKWFVKGMLPIVSLLLILWIFKPIYWVNGSIEWLYLWLLVGIPYGLSRFIFIIIPRNYDIGSTIGIFVMSIILSGFVGGIIAAVVLFKACIYLVSTVLG